MGFFFSNIQIRKKDGITKETVKGLLEEYMRAKGFLPASTEQEADLSVSVFDAAGKWVSVCSDGIEFYTEDSIRDICNPISEKLATDVLIVTCFDSDCLLLNEINRKNHVDIWAKVGHYPEIRQRSTPARWKGLVTDLNVWKKALSEKYVFAEDALERLEPLLELIPGQGHFCTELLPEDFTQGVQTCYYIFPETGVKPLPPCLAVPTYSLMPCEIGKEKFISAVNIGGKSTGLAVAFSGDYVEQEEIRFCNVQLEYDFDRTPRRSILLNLEKRQDPDGKWIYYAEIPQFHLLPGAKQGLTGLKAQKELSKRSFGIRFTPEGNERKCHEIEVHFIPLKNPAGECRWCVGKPLMEENITRLMNAMRPNGAKRPDADASDAY